MSYAGTYGDDETCIHDRYWRSCPDCSEIGPRATPDQIDKRRQERADELVDFYVANLKHQELFAQLRPDEQRVAEAFWVDFLASYPGVGTISLDEAVRGSGVESWAVGRARGICRQAKLAVEALALTTTG